VSERDLYSVYSMKIVVKAYRDISKYLAIIYLFVRRLRFINYHMYMEYILCKISDLNSYN
jgi:hypothetical protein